MITVTEISPKQFKLEKDFVYQGKWETITIPKGFTTDFASVPKLLQWLVSSYGQHLQAALVHDYLWSLARKNQFSFADADGIFKRIMKETGVGPLKRWFMWSAVRVASGPTNWFDHGVQEAVTFFVLATVGALYVAVPSIVAAVFSVLPVLIGKVTKLVDK